MMVFQWCGGDDGVDNDDEMVVITANETVVMVTPIYLWKFLLSFYLPLSQHVPVHPALQLHRP